MKGVYEQNHEPSDLELKTMEYYNNLVEKMEKKYGKKALTNIQVDDIGKKYLKNKYGACLACDEFIKMNKKGDGKIYIVNTENSNQDGEHWLCFIDGEEGLLAYDSYGADIKKYNKLFKKIEFIQDRDDREQRYNNEYNCGIRALASGIIYNKLGKECFLLI